MLKTAVLDSTKQLRLEQEVSEPGAVDPDVAPVGLVGADRNQIGGALYEADESRKAGYVLLCDLPSGLGGGAIDGLVVVLLVVQELLLVDVVLLGLSHPVRGSEANHEKPTEQISRFEKVKFKLWTNSHE